MLERSAKIETSVRHVSLVFCSVLFSREQNRTEQFHRTCSVLFNPCLITWIIWRSPTFYGSFCHFSLRWNLFNNNHDLRRLFQVCGQFPGVHPFSSAHSLLNTEQPFSLPPPRPQELFTLNVLQLPSLSFCDKEISPL